MHLFDIFFLEKALRWIENFGLAVLSFALGDLAFDIGFHKFFSIFFVYISRKRNYDIFGRISLLNIFQKIFAGKGRNVFRRP